MKILITLLIAIAAFAAGVWYTKEYSSAPSETATSTPQETPINTPQAVYDNASADRIVVSTPKSGATVGNTFTVSGQARGGWYFEASFPLEVQSATGSQLMIMPVQAQGEWMTSEFVPFSVQVTVPAYYKGPATLILRNDNASGLPENAASIAIPIVIQ